MRKLLLFFLISVGINAQFNYQAIVKDSDGNPVTNNQVKFKFSLMYQSSTATPVFVEEHDITTPADGVVNLSVGGGSVVNGTFSDIDWSQSVFMKEELDSGSGYQDMGTNRILAVPIAEYAKEAENISFYGSQNMHFGIGSNPYLGLVTNTISIGRMSGVFSNGNDNVYVGRLAGMQIKGSENVGIGNNSMIGGFDVNPQNANNNEVSKYNTAIGFNSLRSVDGGDYNTAVGWNSLNSNTSGYNNIAIGTDALSSNVSGTDNLAIGNGALFQNLGQRNLAVGASSLENNTSGTINTSVGFQSMQFNQTGANNTAIGDSSLYFNTEGDFNVAVGRNSLLDNIDGEGNTAIGDSAGYRNESGSFNTSLGMMSFFSLESGNDNVALGAYSGSGTTTNTNIFTETTFVGAYSGGVNGVQNSTAIGANSIVTTSNTIQLGDTDVTLVNTSADISANDYLVNGGESLVDIVSQLSSSDEVAALSDEVAVLSEDVDDLLNSTLVNFLISDDNKFSVWIEASNSEASNSEEDLEQTFWIINSVSSATFINIITLDNNNDETWSCDLTLPNLTQMLEGEVNHPIEGTIYLVSVSEFSANNFTVKYNSNTDFDSNEDGIGWLKHSYTKISSDLIRFDEYESDNFDSHESYTLQKLSDDYTSLYADLIQYCE
jgi:hypothetical protein